MISKRPVRVLSLVLCKRSRRHKAWGTTLRRSSTLTAMSVDDTQTRRRTSLVSTPKAQKPPAPPWTCAPSVLCTKGHTTGSCTAIALIAVKGDGPGLRTATEGPPRWGGSDGGPRLAGGGRSGGGHDRRQRDGRAMKEEAVSNPRDCEGEEDTGSCQIVIFRLKTFASPCKV